jgi:hypothetical protein
MLVRRKSLALVDWGRLLRLLVLGRVHCIINDYDHIIKSSTRLVIFVNTPKIVHHWTLQSALLSL